MRGLLPWDRMSAMLPRGDLGTQPQLLTLVRGTYSRLSSKKQKPRIEELELRTRGEATETDLCLYRS